MLTTQKRLSAQILKCSPKRVKFDVNSLEDIKEAITKADIRGLINDKAIIKIQAEGVSRGRARKRDSQRRKGRQKGPGSRKGSRTARYPRKRAWIDRVRLQRKFLKLLRDKKVVDKKTYHDLYLKSKGGFFRSKRHIKLYMKEHGLIK